MDILEAQFYGWICIYTSDLPKICKSLVLVTCYVIKLESKHQIRIFDGKIKYLFLGVK
jgi:hypothetical protein